MSVYKNTPSGQWAKRRAQQIAMERKRVRPQAEAFVKHFAPPCGDAYLDHVCSRAEGHNGDHMAHVGQGIVRWPNG